MRAQKYKQASKRTFDRLANAYESDYTGRHARTLYERVATIGAELAHDTILDVGCGKGNLLALLHNGEARLCGVDLSLEMIRYAQERLGTEVALQVADSEHLPWAAKYFDLIVCTDSFHHYPNPEQVLLEMRRVMKDHGHVVIGEAWLPELFRKLINVSFKFSRSGDVKIYSKDEWSSMLTATGFALVQWEQTGYSSVILTAKVSA
jgi:ubiquinone/menaquinone biosynthesis C-methylase UbiE